MTSSSTPIISAAVSLSPPPDPSPASDTEDAHKTAEARIHIGPLKSPQKCIAAIVARRDSLHPVVHSLPLRRSPRLSVPLPQSPLRENRDESFQEEKTRMNVVEEDEEVVDEGMSRTGTPDVEQALQDEFPSSLAIKISRAYDNPSPPPSPSAALGLVGLVFPSPHPFLPSSLTASIFDAANGVRNTKVTTPSTSCSVTTGSSKNISPIPPTTPGTILKTIPADLISFESFSSPAPVFRAMSPSIQAPHASDKSNVDDRQLSRPLDLFSFPEACETQDVPKLTHPPVVSGSFHEKDELEQLEDTEDIAQDHLEEQFVLRSLLPAEEGTHVKAQRPPASHFDNSKRTFTQQSSRSRRSIFRYQDHDQLITQLPQPQRVPAGKVHTQSIFHHPEEDGGIIRETEEDRDMNSPPKSTFLRELGSLSPTSNDLLSSLVAPFQQSSFSLTIPPTKEAGSMRRPFPPSSPLPALPETPRRSTSPIRFANPSRSVARESNTQLQTISSDNSLCTPARRIPIEDAIMQGHISPLKGSQLLASSSRVGLDGFHKPLLTIPPTDSPARRILAPPEVTTPAVLKKWQGIRFGSPTRLSSKGRSNSVEPAASGAFKCKYRERSGSPMGTSSISLRPSASSSSSSGETSKSAKLPFPLVPSRKDAPATEECQAAVDLTTTSPMKSVLKQITSRIPTRTVKPYTKPHSKLEINKGKLTTRKDMPLKDSSKSQTISTRSLTTYRTDGRAKTLLTVDKPDVSPLKRKRAVVEVPSPAKHRPAVTLRQVPRVLVPNTASNPGARALPSINVLKKSQQIRLVIDKSLDVTTNPPVNSISQTASTTSSSGIAPQIQPGASVPELELDQVKLNEKDFSVPEEPESERISAPVVPIDIIKASEPFISNVRRTARVRKVLNPSLISDAYVPAEVKPRRKASAQANVRGDTTYSGMSATALRALTTSNTVRNQRYLAAKLETEIIRKEGDRPESPAVKMKTVLQREQEEKNRQRKDRAAKRARLSGESAGHLNDEDRHNNRDTENESDWDYQSASPSPKTHKRGSGDEEEYRTPVRKLKRLKLVDDDGREESVENERRVKWDRGLFTTISLDQVKLGTRRPPRENIVTKGCLAPAAKTLPLDNLGNLPYADTPLTDLVEENVVVKKFVYDNDVEAVEEVIVKNTRAQSKKGKS
ncbi:hypothetical protein C0989_011418 [Termitomyces sp. Mn162]|nr:hypothetical protein C0989_011418 [Termitomyces sp. Mn162]